MRLSICIPVYNNYSLTKACLFDLSKLPEDVEVIVCDNGSTDDTVKLLNESVLPINFKYIRSEVNLGFAGGSNRAYKEAVGKYVLFLNNDIRVQKDHASWVNLLINKAEKENGIVGPTLGSLFKNTCLFNAETNAKEPEYIYDIKANNYGENTRLFYYISGWCLCAKKEVFDKLITDYLGPWSEDYGLAFHEDPDLCARAYELDIKFYQQYVPVIHIQHMTAKKLNMSKLYNDSRAIFEAKWKKKI